MPVALAKDGRRVEQGETGAGRAAMTPPSGLSAHAQNLWLAAAHYRRLADDLACADGAGSNQ